MKNAIARLNGYPLKGKLDDLIEVINHGYYSMVRAYNQADGDAKKTALLDPARDNFAGLVDVLAVQVANSSNSSGNP